MTLEPYLFRQKWILVVDQDASNRQKIRKCLESHVNVALVGSGREAISRLQDGIAAEEKSTEPPIDVLLLSEVLPDVSGITLLQDIHKLSSFTNLPVIIMTNHVDMQADGRSMLVGAFDVLHVPFLPVTLIKKVRQVLELQYLRHHLESEVRRQTHIAEQQVEKTERLFNETVASLAKTIDAKDRYTHGHSSRVATYAQLIARHLGWSKTEQKKIYIMGLLHDIGKIGIPESIINKTSKLSDEEYSVIQRHTIIGAEILKSVEDFPELSIGAHYHHERYDGKGYPEGLVGDDIPPYARIIAVADTYDAMTSKRSYRDILPQNVVRSEIIKGKSTQFDPIFADAMVKVIDTDRDYQLNEKVLNQLSREKHKND